MKKIAYVIILFTSFISIAHAANFNTDKIAAVLKSSRSDLTLVCAHRGLHASITGTNSHQDWLHNIPENSGVAVAEAVLNNIECSEIDIRLDNAGNVVALHDSNLGRTTNISTGSNQYNPYSNTGYNPEINNINGPATGLYLRNAAIDGITKYQVDTLQSILSFIRDNRLSTVIFLDIRDIETAKKAWPIVKSYSNAWGTPAYKWVYFKINISNVAETPGKFESLGIFNPNTESGIFHFIPVFFANFIDTSNGPQNSLNNWTAFNDRSYVYATELEMKEYDDTLKFPLNNIMNNYYAMRTTGPVKTMGNYQPVPETTNNTYYALDGHCCTYPSAWLWTSTKGFGQDTGDNRTSLNWIMNTAGASYRYIITDDPITAISNLRAAGRRNTAVIEN